MKELRPFKKFKSLFNKQLRKGPNPCAAFGQRGSPVWSLLSHSIKNSQRKALQGVAPLTRVVSTKRDRRKARHCGDHCFTNSRPSLLALAVVQEACSTTHQSRFHKKGWTRSKALRRSLLYVYLTLTPGPCSRARGLQHHSPESFPQKGMDEEQEALRPSLLSYT
jgi:hypothetical protein